ncbi:hypothetical protein Tco_0975786 [Tanacetum coccineum]|uniref:Uncharacterized protein n=1 Tax=Tanacetum coccineum TaxID=301880 RepID=A0ABQ5EFC4_9ASTR
MYPVGGSFVGLEYGRYGLEYGVLPSSGYGVLDLVSFVVFGGDEIEVSDDESFDLEEETAENFKIETDTLEDSELKDEALRNKAIMEGLISDDESGNDCWKRWNSHEIYYHNYDEGEYEKETHEEGHKLCSIKTREVPIYQIKRYKMIKYSFNDEEEYVAVKEDEYDDLTITSEEACRAYQEIFRMMYEGWMVTRTE